MITLHSLLYVQCKFDKTRQIAELRTRFYFFEKGKEEINPLDLQESLADPIYLHSCQEADTYRAL